MYKYYNANKLGKFVNDCSIRAISLAEGTSWDYTYDKMSELAQQEGTMMDDVFFIQNYLNKRYKHITPQTKQSVGEIAGEYPDKVLLIGMDGHITCSVFGIIYDSFDCRRRIAQDFWII